MVYLYGLKSRLPARLVATFDSEEQLRAYVGWATLSRESDGTNKFEQGSVLVGYQRWEAAESPQTKEDPNQVIHNPSPSML